MSTQSLIVLLAIALTIIDLMISALKTPFAHHVLLSVAVILIGIAVLSGSPVITHT